jgi:HAD superfamily hydrolase (TIGR01549 family)
VLDAVLFDLDGTLLDIDLDTFFDSYFAALAPVVAEALGTPDGARAGLGAVLEGTNSMSAPHPGQTNREVFNARFLELTGTDLSVHPHSTALERFYAERFPELQGSMTGLPGAREAIQTALGLGLRVAIATNPIFPRAAIDARMRWAGVHDLPVHLVTSYENMHAAKPRPEYYRQVAEMLGVSPQRALMVGDDRSLDMSAADIGMRTFYVGEGTATADWSGTLAGLSALLPRLAGEPTL